MLLIAASVLLLTISQRRHRPPPPCGSKLKPVVLFCHCDTCWHAVCCCCQLNIDNDAFNGNILQKIRQPVAWQVRVLSSGKGAAAQPASNMLSPRRLPRDHVAKPRCALSSSHRHCRQCAPCNAVTVPGILLACVGSR